jgi:hypothetical protein
MTEMVLFQVILLRLTHHWSNFGRKIVVLNFSNTDLDIEIGFKNIFKDENTTLK